MRVYDGFIFNDELDLLELRFLELDDVVDVFVLVEMPVNFRQQPKALHYLENKDRFDRWNEKLIHVIPESFPVGPHPVIEWFQRRQIVHGFLKADPCDLLLMGDADEIPNPDAIWGFRQRGAKHPYVCEQHLFYHKVNLLAQFPWNGTVLMPRGDGEIDCQKIRSDRHYFPRIESGGWHFSWLGDAKAIEKKMGDIDVERDIAMYPTEIHMKVPDAGLMELAANSERDMFGRDEAIFQKSRVGIEPGKVHPRFIEEWLLTHPEYLA